MTILNKGVKGFGIMAVVFFLFVLVLNFMSAPESKGLFGYKGYIILSGSMESVLTPGDFIIVKAHPYQTIKENDVVTFKMGNQVITHRVVRLSNTGITTKGDANEDEDNNQITQNEYIGTLKAAIPYLGQVLILLQKPYIIAFFVILIGISFIFSAFGKNKT